MPSNENWWGLVKDISNYAGIGSKRRREAEGSSPVAQSLMDGIEDTILRVEIHKLLLEPEIINSNSVVRLECGDYRTHFSIRDSIRGSKNNNGRRGTLVIPMRCSPWNYNFHIFINTEGILSNSVSAQINIPLRQLLDEEIQKKCFTFWNFTKGKHVKLYESGIPQVPGSALPRPQEVGEIELSLKFEHLPEKWLMYSRAPLRFSLITDTSQLEIDGLASRLFRLFERLKLFIKTPPKFVSTVLLPIYDNENPLLTVAYVAMCCYLCFLTPFYLLPADILLLLFILSILSKRNGENVVEQYCICWDDDERLLEPPGGSSTIVGQLLESKKLLMSALVIAEYFVSAVEATSTLFCWENPICTCAAFLICYAAAVGTSILLCGCWGALQVLSIQSWVFLILMSPFVIFRVPALRVFCFSTSTTMDELVVLLKDLTTYSTPLSNVIRTVGCLPAVPEQENAFLASLQARECKDRSRLKAVPFPITPER